MVSSGILRWSLVVVVVALIVVLVTAATVVMASAVLQPQVVPTIKLQPANAAPGDIVAVTGKGWPTLANLVVVIALSPTRDLATESLVPVGAVLVGRDGTFATTFVYPSKVPWTALREAWVVARPPHGDLVASAHLLVIRPKPTPTCTPAMGQTPLPGPSQVQGCIVSLAPAQSLMVLRPFDGSINRGVVIKAASIRFADGRPATAADLQVGVSVIALGWLDSGGTLLATQITILGALSEPPKAAPAAVCAVPVVATPCPPTPAPVSAVPVVATPCPPTPAPVSDLPVATVCAPEPLPAASPTCTPLPPCPPAPQPVPTEAWLAQYFANPSLSGDPGVVITNMVIDYSWGRRAPQEGFPASGYSVRWTGNWFFAKECQYRFLMLLNGGARLWVDDQVVIDAWDCPPPAEQMGRIYLAGGLHTLRVEYYNPGVDARIQLRWEYDGVPH